MSSRTGSGRQLNDEWQIGAAQAFYHKGGTWFNRLERFPGALCDGQGFIRIESEQVYLNHPSIRVGTQTNVPGGISQLRGYRRMR
jgi:hypothetical protein